MRKILFLLFTFFLFTSQAMAEKRVALVIGNDDYDALPELYNTVMNAKGMGRIR